MSQEIGPMLRIALMAYVGERCQGCGKTFDTIESIKDSVWWPWDGGRIGHDECWKANNAEKKGTK